MATNIPPQALSAKETKQKHNLLAGIGKKNVYLHHANKQNLPITENEHINILTIRIPQRHLFYYRGLREYPHIRGYLIDTCLAAQDKFKVLLDYCRINF